MPSHISDALWERLAPLVADAKRTRAGAPPAIPDRRFLEALLFLADSGCKWRQLPDRYGAWDAVYNRYRRWLAAGTFERLFAGPAGRALAPARRVFVDSTTARAHPHAAGARAARGGPPPRPSAAPAAASPPSCTSPAPTSGRPSPSP